MKCRKLKEKHRARGQGRRRVVEPQRARERKQEAGPADLGWSELVLREVECGMHRWQGEGEKQEGVKAG